METRLNSQMRLRLALWSDETHSRALVPRLPADPALSERKQAIIAQSVQHNLPIRCLGTMLLFSGHRVYPGQRRDWVMINVAEDPLFNDRDGFPVPGRVLQQLRTIEKSGLNFNAIYAAHEVERGAVREGEPINVVALLPPPPRTTQRLSRWFGRVGLGLWSAATLPLGLSIVIGSLLVTGLRTSANIAVLDPILLGAIVSPGRPVVPGEQAVWFYLAHWSFDQRP